MEDPKKDKDEDKKEDKKEEKPKTEEKASEGDKNKFNLTEEQQKMLMEQLKKLQLSQKYGKGEIKDEYKFWSTQPVPQFNKECEVEFGEIWKDRR